MHDDLLKNLQSISGTTGEIQEEKIEDPKTPYERGMNLHESLMDETVLESQDPAKPDGNEDNPSKKPAGYKEGITPTPADAKPTGKEDAPKNNMTPASQKKPISDVNYPHKTPVNYKEGDAKVPAGDARPTGKEDMPKLKESGDTQKCTKCGKSFPLKREDGSDYETDLCDDCFAEENPHTVPEGKVVDPSKESPDAQHKKLVEKIQEIAVKGIPEGVAIKEDVEDKIYLGSSGADAFYAEELKDDDNNLTGLNVYNNVDDMVLSTTEKEYTTEDPALLIQNVVNDLNLDSVSFQYMVDLGVLAPPPEEEGEPEVGDEGGETPEGDEETPPEAPAGDEAQPPAEGEEEPTPEEKPDEEEEEPKESKVSEHHKDTPEEQRAWLKSKGIDVPDDATDEEIKDAYLTTEKELGMVESKVAECFTKKEKKTEEAKVADVKNPDLDKIKNDLLEKHGLKEAKSDKSGNTKDELNKLSGIGKKIVSLGDEIKSKPSKIDDVTIAKLNKIVKELNDAIKSMA
jgi:hypothetical protein